MKRVGARRRVGGQRLQGCNSPLAQRASVYQRDVRRAPDAGAARLDACRLRARRLGLRLTCRVLEVVRVLSFFDLPEDVRVLRVVSEAAERLARHVGEARPLDVERPPPTSPLSTDYTLD